MKKRMLLLAPLLLLGCNEKEAEKSETGANKSETTQSPKAVKSEIHGVNQLTAAKQWYPTTDEYGSSLDTGAAMISDDVLKVAFTICKKESDDKWPYVELVCKPKKNLTGTESVSITYKCDKNLLVKFSQTDFSHLGDESYAHYQMNFPPSAEWKTVEFKVTDAKQPSWTPAKAKGVPLKLENVDAVYFTPELSVETGGSGTVELKELTLK